MSDDTKALVPVDGERSADERPNKRQLRVPALIETAYAVSLYTVVVATVATVILALAAGADLLMTVIRGGSVVLVLGLVAWVFNYRLMHGALAAVDDLRRQQGVEPATQSEGSISMGLKWRA